MIVKSLHLISSLACAAMLSGCALDPATTSASNRVLVEYATPAVQEHVAKAGLLHLVKDYWQAHVRRDWAARYAMEHFPRPLEERFYVAYHANAWKLLGVSVTAVSLRPNECEIDLTLRFNDPTSQTDATQQLRDHWIFVDGQWRHKVTDPMLSGVMP